MTDPGPGPGAALTYLGWSGFALAFADTPMLFIDPPDALEIPGDRDICLLITHGHPEHVSGALGYLRDQDRSGAATVVAPPGLCRYLERRSRHTRDRFHACEPGMSLTVGGVTVDGFRCHHMPLLPPEKGAARAHLARLAGNPRLAVGIAVDVLRGPPAGPLLGFRLGHADSPKILFFGEGLHRGIDRGSIAEIAASHPADVLIAAVEPEDMAVLPDMMLAAGAPAVVPYEAHRPWRDGFGMPRADLDALSSTLAGRGLEVVRAALKVPVGLPGGP